MRLRHQWATLGLLSLFIWMGVGRADQCDPSDPNLLLPDLIAENPTGVRVVREYGHRLVIFNTIIGNIGDGPLVVQGHTVTMPDGTQKTQGIQEISRRDGSTCDHTAGFFEFHPSHHHFHIDDFASYQLRQDDPTTGPIVGESSKVSFCLLDVVQLRGFHDPRQVVADCGSADGVQGISVGYADEYASFLPGQYIDLDADPAHPIPPGDYFLVNVANPDGIILEKSQDNNVGVVSVRVPSALSAGAGGTTGSTDPHQPPPVTMPHPPPHTHAPHTPQSPHPSPHPHAPHTPPHLHVTAHPHPHTVPVP